MAVAPSSNVASVLTWDKNQTPPKVAPAKGNRSLRMIGALAVVVLMGLGLWRYNHTPKTQAVVQVVAAGMEIPAGVKLGFTSLHYLVIPKAFATADMVTSYDRVNDCVSRTFISIGEPIKMSMLLPKNTGLSGNLENDERAISLDLNSDAIVDHSIQPDDLVDVIAVTTNKDGKKYTKTIGQAIRVLIATPKEQLLARSLNNTAGKGITLAVSPDQAEAITEASEIGKLRLVLRNRLTYVNHKLNGVGPNELLPDCANADALKPSVPLTLPPISLEAVQTDLPPPATDNKPTAPLQWLVEVITGSHKETYGVPEQ